jgi:hypothetical protein
LEKKIEDEIAEAWPFYRMVKGQHSIEHIHIARYIRPELAEFFEERKTTDRPAIELLWDDTAIKANDMFSRGIWSLAHNSSTEWFNYKDKNPAVMADAEATAWYQRVTEDLRDQCLSSGLYQALLMRLADVGAFGFGAVYSYEIPGTDGQIAFEWVPASECFYTTNREGLANSFIRPLNLTAREAIDEREWPRELLDQTILDAYERRDVNTKFLFLHVVWERKGFDPRKRARSNKDYRYAGYYYSTVGRKVVNEHGFRDFPYHVLGWGGASNTPYPVGIGYRTLPEVRNLNSNRKKFDRLLDVESDSPLLAPNQDEGVGGQQFKPQAGAMIYGGMSGDGKRLYEPLYTGQGSRSLESETATSRALIQEAYNYQLFMMVTQRQMTAEEVRSRDAKLVQAMSPYMVLMSKDLRTIIERIFYARMAAGVYNPMPAIFDANTKMDLKFTGILGKAQQVLEGEQIVGLYAEAQFIATYDPDAIIHGIDHGAALIALGSSKSLPGTIVLSKEQAQKNREAAAQQKQQMQAAAMAPGLAKAAKDGAGALNEMGVNGQNLTASPVAA